MPYSYNKREAQTVYFHSLVSSCFVAQMSMPVGIVNRVAKPQTQFTHLVAHVCTDIDLSIFP